MYIEAINIRKFRHLENAAIGPLKVLGNSSDLIALAGPNGGGKSSVLELVGFAMSNSYSLSWALARTFEDYSFEVKIALTKHEIGIVVDALRQELAPVEQELVKRKAEIDAMGLTPEDASARLESVRLHTRRPHKFQYEIIEYFSKSNYYYRSFNFPGGEYEKHATLYNQVHEHVTRELRNKLRRSLGFSLRADRGYPSRGFDRNKIFEFPNLNQQEHLWTIAFNTSDVQYKDMYEYLVQLRYHYLRELGAYHAHPIASRPPISATPRAAAASRRRPPI